VTIRVRLAGPLRPHAGGAAEVTVELGPEEPHTVGRLLERLERQHPGLAGMIRDERGAIRRHVNVFAGAEHVRELGGLAAPVSARDPVSILPAVSGGAEPWWDWRPSAAAYTVGAEEEVMLLEAGDLGLAGDADGVIAGLPPDMAAHVALETHAAALELRTGVHRSAGAAAAELAGLRARLAARLEGYGLLAASAGTHPLALGLGTELSPHERYRHLHHELGELTQREPTFGLHVHVGLEGPETALRAFNHIRSRIPLLVALGANSPFWRGRDSGLAAIRVVIFDAFPRTGPPRAFGAYEDYVEAVQCLIRPGAIPDPSFVWWDLRLQPSLGTLEVRVLDAQRTVAETASLVALVQCMVRAAAEDDAPRTDPLPEVLMENRFLAARDGPSAHLIEGGARVPVAIILHRVLDECRPHAAALDCEPELQGAAALVEGGGAAVQRTTAELLGVSGLPAALAAVYAAQAIVTSSER
jgi:carboxylate-amine ligase